MPTLTTRDGASVAYFVDDFTPPWKPKETLLLAHAAMGASRRFFSWIPQLAARYQVLRFDLRGHGESGPVDPGQPFSLQMLVDDALEVLDEVGVRKFHAVGNSAGGYVAQQLAMNCPERVRSLAVFGSTPGLKNSHAMTWLPRIREMGLRAFLAATISERFDVDADPELVNWFLDQTGSNDPAFIERFMTELCRYDWMDQLGRIQCPTLIVAAGGEQIGSSNAYEQMKKRIPLSQLILYPTSGHAIADAHAQRCVEDLLAFLGKVQ